MGPGQASKRAFVKVLLRIAALYRVVCNISRDSTEAELNSAFRKVGARCHPDKGGDPEHSKELNAARDTWKRTQGSATAQPAPPASSSSVASPEKGFRIHSTAVLLTYNRTVDLAHWDARLKAHWANSI